MQTLEGEGFDIIRKGNGLVLIDRLDAPSMFIEDDATGSLDIRVEKDGYEPLCARLALKDGRAKVEEVKGGMLELTADTFIARLRAVH